MTKLRLSLLQSIFYTLQLQLLSLQLYIFLKYFSYTIFIFLYVYVSIGNYRVYFHPSTLIPHFQNDSNSVLGVFSQRLPKISNATLRVQSVSFS